MSFVELEYVLRIILATACGGAVGFERERRAKSAGIRTHLIVALSASMMMVISKYGFFDVVGLVTGLNVDASRVAAGVVSAIGFLGAGVIFFRKDSVSGVTTAAGLWATVGVGMAIGSGLYFTGLVCTGLIVILQLLLHRKSPLVKPQRLGVVELVLEKGRMDEADVQEMLEGLAEHVDDIVLRRVDEAHVEVRCMVYFPADLDTQHLLRAMEFIPELRGVEMRVPHS